MTDPSPISESARTLADYQRIIIHAGLHKTGTSYIQKLLHLNRETLAGKGIHFPQYHAGRRRRETGNHSAAVKACDRRTESLDQILGEWLNVHSPHPVLLLSAEALATRIPMNGHFSQQLAALAKNADVHIVYYLRRQDHLLESLFGEMVKKHDLCSPTDVNYTLDYVELVQSIEAAVPQARITLRPYNSAKWKFQDLGADFFDAIDFPGLWDHLEPKAIARENERLERGQIFLLSIARTAQEKRQLAHFFQRSPNKTAERDYGFFLSPAERKDILLQYAETNDQLVKRYRLGDWKEFFGVDLDGFAREAWRRFDDDSKLHWQDHLLKIENGIREIRNASRSQRSSIRANSLTRFRHGSLRDQNNAGNPVSSFAESPFAGISTKESYGTSMSSAAGSRRLDKTNRKAILHVGLPKTGTTAIQKTFGTISERLLDTARTLYPKSVGINHTDFFRIMFDAVPTSPVGEQIAERKIQNLKRKLDFREGTEGLRTHCSQLIQDELNQPGWETVLFSGEGLSNFGRSALASLREWLMGHVNEITVVFCVRHPVDWTRSAVQQLVKRGLTLETMALKPPLPHFRKRLSRMIDVFGRENINIMCFEEAALHKNRIAGHLADLFGMGAALCGAQVPASVNESMSHEAVLLLDRFNSERLRNAENSAAALSSLPDTRTALGGFARLKNYHGEKFTLDARLAEELRKTCRADVEWLNSTFGVSYYLDLCDDSAAETQLQPLD